MYFIENILRLSELFRGVSDEQLRQLLPFCREEVYEAGKILFSPGEPVHSVYIVETGTVSLEMDLNIGRGKGKATIGVVTRGGCLGRSGLVSPYIHTLTGRTLEKAEVIALDSRVIRRWLEENPDSAAKVMNNVAKVVSSRLEHTNDTLGHILSIVFHDIKAPLAAVESVNKLILGGYCGQLDEEQREMLQSSSKGITNLLETLNNIASLSRIGIRDTVVSKISLSELIKDSVSEMLPLADDKGLKISDETTQEIPEVSADGAQIKHVLINLISNAIKYTPAKGGKVTVKARDEDDYIRVKVTDTGIGISPKELPRIFDEFYRGLDLTERGAGLGLAIARQIVESHQGKLWAISPPPDKDKGSQFIFTLPKARKDVPDKVPIEGAG